MKFTALARLERNVHRAGEIINVLAKYNVVPPARRYALSALMQWLSLVKSGDS